MEWIVFVGYALARPFISIECVILFFLYACLVTPILGDREKRRDESFQVSAKEPLGTDFHRTISKNSSGCRLLIGHKKCFVFFGPIGEQFLLSSFRELVHDGYCLDDGLSGSCTKEMHAVSKLSVWHIKIPIWVQNTVCPRAKDAFKYKLELTTGIHAWIGHVLCRY